MPQRQLLLPAGTNKHGGSASTDRRLPVDHANDDDGENDADADGNAKAKAKAIANVGVNTNTNTISDVDGDSDSDSDGDGDGNGDEDEDDNNEDEDDDDDDMGQFELPSTTNEVAAPTLLQPRVAVVLGVPAPWHRPLFLCRLLSIAPAVWFGIPPALRLLLQLHHRLVFGSRGQSQAGQCYSNGQPRLIETMLAILWCGASSYLSFFFTDCLMSRWLLNYTPQATIVRLLAINALNGYLTSWFLYLAGAPEDPRLLLPAWITIATTLTAIYHTTQRKINIRKETSISISVFSMTSFISMLCLLAQAHLDRSDHEQYPHVPLISLLRRLSVFAGSVFLSLMRAMRDGIGDSLGPGHAMHNF